MRTIGTEEHFVSEAVLSAWARSDPDTAGAFRSRAGEGELAHRLAELGDERIAWMDAVGLDVQVISLTSPGLHNLPAGEAVALQTETNDLIAATVSRHPERLQGFATLATPAPEAAAAELERVVRGLGLQGALLFGRTGERNLDASENWVIFEAAESLRAPLYIHPQAPQPAVRQAIYEGYGDGISSAFATRGIGWHYETGIQFLRLCLAGVFERFPELQVILGHWGEVILFYLERADELALQAQLARPFTEYVRRNAYITPGGVYSHRYLRWACEVVPADRLLFAADYPYRPAPEMGIRAWLDAGELGPGTTEAIAAGNWDALTARIHR
ncbi:MAG TPA: amidohydrolase family protein [Solirubrobacteraceae bacterium]|nr:amidohydrolase family protein [Solirubrobacteraceae bacterium]